MCLKLHSKRIGITIIYIPLLHAFQDNILLLNYKQPEVFALVRFRHTWASCKIFSDQVAIKCITIILNVGKCVVDFCDTPKSFSMEVKIVGK